MNLLKIHPCLSCGACCAYFRVSFHWSETLPESYAVPIELTNNVSPHQNSMNGTNQIKPSCVALAGVVGQSTSCNIYENRPSTCRSFQASYENGFENTDCEKARASKGLIKLSLSDWNIN